MFTDEASPHFPSYTHTDRDALETLPLFFFFSQSALPVGSLEVLCPSSPCPWELCLRAGAGGVPRCTMCASHSGSRCTPPPLHGSGELPNSEGLSVRVGERACYHSTALKHLTSFPHDSRPDINHFPGLADYNGMLGKMLLWIIRLIAINSVKRCANDWGSCSFHILLWQRLNHRVECAVPAQWNQEISLKHAEN